MCVDELSAGVMTRDGRPILTALAALAWIDGDSRPHLIVDDGLRIHWANSAAVSQLQRAQEIEERGGCLVLSDSEATSTLLRRLSTAQSDLVTCVMPLESADGHLLIRARRLECGDEILFGMVLVRTDGSDPSRFRDLDKAFGLTPAENRVLLSLLDGKDADQITREVDVSMVTIRTHIRSIYSKLEVNSRERLFAKAMPFRT